MCGSSSEKSRRDSGHILHLICVLLQSFDKAPDMYSSWRRFLCFYEVRNFSSPAKLKVTYRCKLIWAEMPAFSEKNSLREYAKHRRNLKLGLKFLCHQQGLRSSNHRAGLLAPVTTWQHHTARPLSQQNIPITNTATAQVPFNLAHTTFAPTVERSTCQ